MTRFYPKFLFLALAAGLSAAATAAPAHDANAMLRQLMGAGPRHMPPARMIAPTPEGPIVVTPRPMPGDALAMVDRLIERMGHRPHPHAVPAPMVRPAPPHAHPRARLPRRPAPPFAWRERCLGAHTWLGHRAAWEALAGFRGPFGPARCLPAPSGWAMLRSGASLTFSARVHSGAGWALIRHAPAASVTVSFHD